ncbi:MAG: hypothetical protein IIZ17_03025 [Eubacteriaceae bacterium]|nr:hypothetical protein [Eubacteriaceae bacterium]
MKRDENRRHGSSGKRTVRKQISKRTASVFIIIFLVLYLALGIYERSCIISLDAEIRQLEEDYRHAVNYNDDLQAKLLSSSGITEIERYAVQVLGMVKPQSTSISYVIYDKNDTASIESAGGSWFAEWISGLF